MKKSYKLLSLLLAVLMIFSSLPLVNAFAVAAHTHTDNSGDELCDLCGTTVGNISAGAMKNVTVTAGQTAYLKFIPSVSGIYFFYSEAVSGDPVGYLFDSSKNEITSNDDGGSNGNFWLVYDLTAGTTYYLGCAYYNEEGSAATTGKYNVTVMMSAYSSISFTPANPSNYVFTDGVDGHFEEDDDGIKYFCFDAPEIMPGDKITVTKKNGVSTEYIYTNAEEGYFSASNGDKIYADGDSSSIGVTIDTNQNNNHWTVGGANNYIIVRAFGISCKYYVTVKENSVASISFTPKENITLTEGISSGSLHSFIDENDFEEFYYYYNLPEFKAGDKLTVNYKDGSSEVYVYTVPSEDGDPVFKSGSKAIDPDLISKYAPQDGAAATNWAKDFSNTFTVEYAGCTCEVPVTIIENPVDRIVYNITDANALHLLENYSAGAYVSDGDNKFYQYDIPVSAGDTITVLYKDGTSEALTCKVDGTTKYFLRQNGKKVAIKFSDIGADSSEVCMTSDQSNGSYEYRWGIGSEFNNFRISYLGKIITINVFFADPSTCAHGNTVVIPAIQATCTKTGLTAGSRCAFCGKTLATQTVTPVTAHISDGGKVTKKATCSAEGVKTHTCTVCKAVIKTEKIKKVAHKYINKVNTAGTNSVPTCSVCSAKKSASKVAVTLAKTSYIYSGKTISPAVTIKVGSTTLKKDKDYSVSYKNNKNVGKATVTIKFKGSYSGTVTKTFNILPSGTSVSKLSAVSKGFKATWKKQTTQTTGYQIQYSTSSKFTSPKTVTVKSTKTLTKSVTGLKANTKYYVRVRTFKTVSGANYYSAWSKVVSVKTKK